MNKRWVYREQDRILAERLSKELELPAFLGSLLAGRGLLDAAQARKFLQGEMTDLNPPLGLRGMKEAVERLAQALQRREKVTIFGDYDVDGVTSTSLLMRVFSLVGLQADYYIPDRLKEGYGPNVPALEALSRQGTRVVVTVDCGVNALEEARAAASLGLDLIVTDHHVPGPELPACLAVINPKTSPDYGYEMLAGVGVAYKLAEALLEKLAHPDARAILDGVLELVALGTVADLAPLDGENRILVREGIRRLRLGRWLGLNCLAEVAGLEIPKLDSTSIGFMLGPRLNAGGRIGDPKLGVELILSRDKAQAMDLARRLDAENKERREIEKEVLDEAKELAADLVSRNGHKVVVVSGQGWHPGVVGLVASRLQDTFHRPSLVIALDPALGRGSARCQRPFHWVKALEHSARHLVRFGGHEYAAGVTVLPEKVGELRESLNDYASQVLQDEDLIPSQRIDQDVDLSQMTEGLMRELGRLSPFGMRNAKPVFAALGCRLLPGTRVIGKTGDHLRLNVGQGGARMEGVAFKMGADLAQIDQNRDLDLAFQLSWNDFRGQRTLQLDVKDIRQAP